MRIALFVIQLGFLTVVGWALAVGPLQAPIFASASRAPAAHGEGWHAGDIHAPYLMSEYSMAQARGWLQTAHQTDDAEELDNAIEHLRQHARNAISETPTNGYAWAALAWAENLAGNQVATLDALRRSRSWAPNAPPLALERVLIAQSLWIGLDDDDRSAVLKDILIASKGYGRRFRDTVSASPMMALLLDLARAQESDGS